MKKLLIAITMASAVLFSGCAFIPYQPGVVYSSMDYPMWVTNNDVSCQKRGTAEVTNILGWISTGDASIAAAKANGHITKVGSTNFHFSNIFGIVSHTTTIVCGE